MIHVTDKSIGQRIRELRGKVLTQRQLAELAGVSVDLVRKLEQGSRQTASIGSLQKLARALDVDLANLIGQTAAMPSGDLSAGVVAIRRSLTPVDDLLDDVVVEAEALTVDAGQRALDYAWGAYWSGRYDLLGSLLPTMLPQLRATAHAAKSADRERSFDLLARVYWLTGSTLVHFGQTDPAYLAIRQALAAVDHAGDELLAATLRGSVAWQLLVQGRYEESRRVAVKTAENIQPIGGVSLPHLSVFGSLTILAANAAGRDGLELEARALVDTAREVSGRMGVDRKDYEAYFGPSQVVMQAADVHVVTENYAAALEAAKQMPPNSTLPLAARARHLADQALAHARLGNGGRALDALLAAERIGPDWIKYQTLPRRIVAELLDRDRRAPLRNFALRLGVTG